MRAQALRIALAGSMALLVGLVWFSDLPLGVPGEWEWTRAPWSGSLLLTFATLAIAGAGYLAFVWLGARRIDRATPAERAVWLAGLAAAGLAWLWLAQEAAPEGYQLSKVAWVLPFRGPSGYFSEALEDPRPVAEFLEDYERLVQDGDVLHLGTHPPGLIVVCRALLAVTRGSPALSQALVQCEPETVRSSFETVRETNATRSLPLDRADEAALWLAGLLGMVAAAAAVCPLYGLLRWRQSPGASWLAASLWPAVPAVAVFLPKSDAWFGCLTALVLWLAIVGWSRRSPLCCALAGLALWVSLNLSLAFLAVGFLATAAPLFDWLGRRERLAEDGGESPSGRSVGACVLAAAAGFGIPLLLAWWLWGIDLLAVWRINLSKHAGFYAAYSRTYWKWLLVNPIEFAVAAGIPLAVLSVATTIRGWRTGGLVRGAPAAAVWATWGLLWISGKNMGEVARLWTFLIPGLIWAAGAAFEPAPAAELPRQAIARSRLRGLALVALQLIACAALVTRVVGFHY